MKIFCENIYGIPSIKSSQLYTILCNLYGYPKEISVIGICYGFEKPAQANELLEHFINEAIK